MAAGTSVINVAILGDARKFKKAVGEANDKLGALGSKIGTVSTNVIKGFGLMTAAAGGLAVVAGKQLFDLGEELVSLDQKIGTVFSGQSLEQVTGWADEVAARMGLTATQAAGLAANAGDLLKPMGFTADEAANIATEVVGLSGALSEWSGGQRSVEETAEILQKALLGERDSLKSLGISINQAEVDQRAMNIAQADGRDAITAMDKALATQQLILEKSTDAQDAYAAGGNDLTAAQNKLKAALGEVKETMARKLLPVFARGAEVAVQLIEVFNERGLGGVIRDLARRFRDAWPQIRQQLDTWARAFVGWIQTVGPPFLAAFTNFLASFAQWWYTQAVPKILEQLASWTGAFIDWAKDIAPPVIAKLQNLTLQLARWFVDDALPVIVAKLQQWASAFFDWASEIVPPLLRQLGDLIAQFANWFSSDGLNMIVTKLAEWAAAFLEWIGPLIPPALRELGNLLSAIAEWILTTGLPNLLTNLFQWTQAFIGWLVDVWPGILNGLRGLMASFNGWMIDSGIPMMIEAGANLGRSFIEGMALIREELKHAAKNMGVGIVQGIVDGIKAAPNAIVNALKSILPGNLSKAVGIVTGVYNAAKSGLTASATVTPFAEGGVVTSPTLALIGEAGPEAVVPLDRAGGMGGGMNVTVNMPPGADGADVVAALQRYARAHGGSVPILTGQL